jgi:primosomal protein N'
MNKFKTKKKNTQFEVVIGARKSIFMPFVEK